jgi:hypothetical protein
MSPDEKAAHEEKKIADMKAAISVRLRHVCNTMDNSEFDLLVTRIATFKIKWGESLIYDNPPALGAWMFGREKEESARK